MRRALDISDADVSQYITTSFGEAGYGVFGRHAGYDYGVVERPVKAAEAGVITATYTNRENVDGGNIVELRSGQYDHRFLHLKIISVVPGQEVSEGFTLAISGNTGNVGYHLHHDTRIKGTAWDASFDNYVDWERMLVENKGEDMEIIENTNEARQIALTYGLEIAGNDPFLGRAVGTTELEYRTSLASMCANNVKVLNETRDQLSQCQSSKPSAGTVLAPGNYVVKG